MISLNYFKTEKKNSAWPTDKDGAQRPRHLESMPLLAFEQILDHLDVTSLHRLARCSSTMAAEISEWNKLQNFRLLPAAMIHDPAIILNARSGRFLHPMKVILPQYRGGKRNAGIFHETLSKAVYDCVRSCVNFPHSDLGTMVADNFWPRSLSEKQGDVRLPLFGLPREKVPLLNIICAMDFLRELDTKGTGWLDTLSPRNGRSSFLMRMLEEFPEDHFLGLFIEIRDDLLNRREKCSRFPSMVHKIDKKLFKVAVESLFYGAWAGSKGIVGACREFMPEHWDPGALTIISLCEERPSLTFRCIKELQ